MPKPQLQSLCQKSKISPFANSEGRQRILLGTDIVSFVTNTPIIRLGGIDGSWLRDKNKEFQFLLREHQWQKCCHGNITKGVILFLLRCTFGAKVQELCFNISRDIDSLVFITFLS